MRSQHAILAALIPLLIVLGACTTMPGTVKYDDFGLYTENPAPDIKYKIIGPVSADESEFLWTNCDDVTEEIASDLKKQAQALGGDAVIEVRWRNGQIAPACRRNYWLFSIYPFFAPWWFMPWGTVSSASGIAIKVERTTP